MRYEFIKKTLDEYVLKYIDKNGNEKEIPFKRTIDMATKMQSITALARMKMVAEMTENGYKREDFISKIDDGKGQVVYDESQLKYIEQGYIEQEQGKVVYKTIEETLGISLDDLLTDMGLEVNSNKPEDIQAVSLFTQKFAMLTADKKNETPSGERKEQL